MRIEDLKECVILSQVLNFTEAAKASYITQSVLSKHISALENEIGARIFVRDKHGVRITPAGRVFIREATEIVNKFDTAITKVNDIKMGIERVLRIGFLYGAGYSILPPAVSQFALDHPETFLRFKAYELDDIWDALSAGEIDIGITTSYGVDHLLANRKYGWASLYPDSLSVIVPADHPEARRDSIIAADLKGYTLVQPTPPFMTDVAEQMLKYINSEENNMRILRMITDLQSLQMVMRTKNYITFSFGHLKSLFGDQYAFIPLEEASEVKIDVIVIWCTAHEDKVVLDFIKTLKKQQPIM